VATNKSDRAVVIGASMAGLCAARVLAERFRQVVIVDRDALGIHPAARQRVPQGRHPHLLLPAGARLLEAWFPALGDELRRAGAVDVDLCADFLWYQAGGTQRRPSSTLHCPAMSRPLLEWTVRTRVAALDNVEIREGGSVNGLEIDARRDRVVGVHVASGERVSADLVVDATGRPARTVDWLVDAGYPRPKTSVVEVDTRYVSRVYRRDDSPERDWKAAAVIGDPESKRLAMVLPMEGDRWILSLAGVNGEGPAPDDAAMLAYARQLDSPVVADLIEHSESLGDPVVHRFPSSQRRHVERLRRFPLGWVLVGDAVCSFDPIYGQGMTSAAQQAAALGDALDRHGGPTRRFARAYFRAASRVVSPPWSIAAGGDFAYPDTIGKKPVGTDLLNRYMDRVVQAGRHDDHVVIRLNEVIALVRRPEALLAPAFALRVLAHARQVDRGQGTQARPRAEHRI
jgi:2-polyprenyl-6-methoxyphenol hydroxylase-like FAD-dependent oxidoreductase